MAQHPDLGRAHRVIRNRNACKRMAAIPQNLAPGRAAPRHSPAPIVGRFLASQWEARCAALPKVMAIATACSSEVRRKCRWTFENNTSNNTLRMKKGKALGATQSESSKVRQESRCLRRSRSGRKGSTVANPREAFGAWTGAGIVPQRLRERAAQLIGLVLASKDGRPVLTCSAGRRRALKLPSPNINSDSARQMSTRQTCIKSSAASRRLMLPRSERPSTIHCRVNSMNHRHMLRRLCALRSCINVARVDQRGIPKLRTELAK
jgi:hypothetical protein